MAQTVKFSRPFLGARTPLQDVIGIITPAALHYYDSHGYIPPDIDPKQHRLLVHGMVDRSMIFTMEDVQRLPAVTRTHFLECNVKRNDLRGRGGKTRKRRDPADGHARAAPVAAYGLRGGRYPASWKWWAWCKKARPGSLQKRRRGRAFQKGLPSEQVMDDFMRLPGATNGGAVRPEQGHPLRLISQGYEGIYNVKWLRRLELVGLARDRREGTLLQHHGGRRASMRTTNRAGSDSEMGVRIR